MTGPQADFFTFMAGFGLSKFMAAFQLSGLPNLWLITG